MLQLKINVNFDDCSCKAAFEDITGFSVNTGSDGKFIPEGAPLPTNEDFNLSSGTFINAIYLKDYDDRITVFETSDVPNVIPSADVNPIYAENIKIANETLEKDGRIYIGRYFIMSKAFYESRLSTWFDINKDICYYDESDGNFYLISEGVTTVIPTVKDLVEKVDTKLTQGLTYTAKVLFSICHLKKCYQNMLQDRFDKILGYDEKTGRNRCLSGNCTDDSDTALLKTNLEILHNAIASIEYLLGCGNYDDAMRLLKLLGNCGGICSKYNKTSSRNGCGC